MYSGHYTTSIVKKNILLLQKQNYRVWTDWYQHSSTAYVVLYKSITDSQGSSNSFIFQVLPLISNDLTQKSIGFQLLYYSFSKHDYMNQLWKYIYHITTKMQQYCSI